MHDSIALQVIVDVCDSFVVELSSKNWERGSQKQS